MSNPASSASTPRTAESPASTPATSLTPILSSLVPPLPGGAAARAQPTKAKPLNVFSNDGSFLERFQRTKKEEDEKRKHDEMIARKRAFDDRFRNRCKRKAPPPTEPTEPIPPAKKAKELTQYEKEVKSYEGRSLKDQGIGIRPLVK